VKKNYKDKALELWGKIEPHLRTIIAAAMLSFVLLGLTTIISKKSNIKEEEFLENKITHQIFITPKRGKYYQLLIPSNDGLMSFTIFMTTEDLLKLKENIENIKEMQ